MDQDSFIPSSITIAAGATVVWENTSPIPHTVTAEDGSYDAGVLQPGQTFSQTFPEAGTYRFFCQIHPDTMRGTITVEG